MKQSIRNQFDQVYYEADFDAENNWVFVSCRGELTLTDIQKGAMAFAELFEISTASKLLNDTRDVVGEFADLKHWTNVESTKALSELGLKYYAHVTADLGNDQLIEFTSRLLSLGIKYEVFKSVGKAKSWLSQFED
jgi:hypothetical protein